jgi:hypothetical protein
MKIKLSITSLFFLLVLRSSYAQYADFDLSRYKLPDIKTSSLDFVFNLNHSISANSTENNLSPLQKYHSRNGGGLLNLNLQHFRNRANYQGEQLVFASLEPDYVKTTAGTSISKQNFFPASINIFSNNRFFNDANNFIEVNPSMGYSKNNILASSSSRSERDIERYFSFSVPLAIGHGRIEPVEDARLAVYILEELSKNDRISVRPSDAIILDLAQEISRIKRKRFFDSRVRKIKEMQAIDSFLLANNIVSNSDIVYFTRLNDMWDYASGPARNSGFSVSLGVDNGINLNKYYYKVIHAGIDTMLDNSKVLGYMFGPYFNLRHSRPISLYWQSDLSMTLAYDYRITRDPLEKSSKFSNYEESILSASFGYELKFLPDSRTSASLSAGGSYRYSFGEKYGHDGVGDTDIPGKYRGQQFSPYTGLNVQYYISPQLRLYFTWTLGLNRSSDTYEYETILSDIFYKSNTFSHNIMLRMTYSFF